MSRYIRYAGGPLFSNLIRVLYFFLFVHEKYVSSSQSCSRSTKLMGSIAICLLHLKKRMPVGAAHSRCSLSVVLS